MHRSAIVFDDLRHQRDQRTVGHQLRQAWVCSQPALPSLGKQASEEASGAAWTRDQASAATSEAQSKAQRPPLPPEQSRQACWTLLACVL